MAELDAIKGDIKLMVDAITALARQVADVHVLCRNLQMEIKHKVTSRFVLVCQMQFLSEEI